MIGLARPEIEIHRLGERDLCDDFSAGPGHEALDRFLREYARQNNKKSASATYVALVENQVAAFATIVAAGIHPDELGDAAKGLSKAYKAPLQILARMGTDRRFQGKGIGDEMMRRLVFPKATQLAESHGCIGLAVDAKPNALKFYAKYGFDQLPQAESESTTKLFMPIKKIRTFITA